MYFEVKIFHNIAMVFMLNDRKKNPVARYRSFLDTLYLHWHNFYSFVNPGLWMTVGEDSVQYRKDKSTASYSSSHFAFYR